MSDCNKILQNAMWLEGVPVSQYLIHYYQEYQHGKFTNFDKEVALASLNEGPEVLCGEEIHTYIHTYIYT